MVSLRREAWGFSFIKKEPPENSEGLFVKNVMYKVCQLNR